MWHELPIKYCHVSRKKSPQQGFQYIFCQEIVLGFEHKVIVFVKIAFWAFINSCQNRFRPCKVVPKQYLGFAKISVKLVFEFYKISAKLVFGLCKNKCQISIWVLQDFVKILSCSNGLLRSVVSCRVVMGFQRCRIITSFQRCHAVW